ncbi:MAG TPA: hypothetical protein VLT87_14190 [Thermoanaerobaculia bacterium]|nr:hypothetical protein [Thermoanaerobaculia bacterium]
MRSTTLIATAALALSLTSAAHAQWSNRYPDRHSGYDRSGRVGSLAYEIEEIASSIHREAERNNRRPDRNEARVLADLHELEERAEEFRNGLDGRDRHDRDRHDRYRDSRHDNRDFDQLVDAFYTTAESLRYIDRRPYIDRGMDRIYTLLGEVSRYYGGSRNDRWGSGRGWRDYDGRYGRDRHDRGRGRYDRDNRWRQ